MHQHAISLGTGSFRIARLAALQPAKRTSYSCSVQCMAQRQGDLSGKTYLITGSTDGIGLHTARRLAAAGADVIVHGRSADKIKKVQQELARQGSQISSYTCDLASLSQIRQFAEAVKADHKSIDVLINNAGVFETRKSLSEDGFELTWAVNVLAPFLLTALLKDIVTERIVNVSSISAGSRIDFDNLQQEKGFSSHDSYSLSKLASPMFTFELAELMKPKGIVVNCLDPGTVNTKMLLAGWGACGIEVQDANNEFKLATDPSLAKVTGKYFVGGRESRGASTAQDPKTRRKLWQIMTEQTGAVY